MKTKIIIAIAMILSLMTSCVDQNKPTPPTAFEDGKTHNWKIVYYRVNHKYSFPDTYRALDSTNVNTITYDSVSSNTNLTNNLCDMTKVPRGTYILKKSYETKTTEKSDMFFEVYHAEKHSSDLKITVTLQN